MPFSGLDVCAVRRPALVAVALVIASLQTSCSGGFDTNDWFDVTADFTTYRTYDYLGGAAQTTGQIPPELAEPIDAVVRPAIEEKLSEHRFRRETSRKPHLYVTYQTIIRDLEYTNPQYESGTFEEDAGRQQFGQGAIIIDMVDAETNRLVWRGWTKTNVDRDRTAEAVETGEVNTDRIRAAVRRILQHFPPD